MTFDERVVVYRVGGLGEYGDDGRPDWDEVKQDVLLQVLGGNAAKFAAHKALKLIA